MHESLRQWLCIMILSYGQLDIVLWGFTTTSGDMCYYYQLV